MGDGDVADMDLDLDHYDYEDLKNLFHIQGALDEDALAMARRTVYRSHPDKSGLPHDIFMFYSKAFKLLASLVRGGAARCDEDVAIPATQGAVSALTESDDFSRRFNALFEKHAKCLTEDGGGHGSWLSDAKQDARPTVTSKAGMDAAFEEERRRSAALIVHDGVSGLPSGGGFGTSLEDDATVYGSSMFASLGYGDVQEAHGQWAIPVTTGPVRQQTLEGAQAERGQGICPLDAEESRAQLRNAQQAEDDAGIQRAFRMQQQAQRAEAANSRVAGALHLIGS